MLEERDAIRFTLFGREWEVERKNLLYLAILVTILGLLFFLYLLAQAFGGDKTKTITDAEGNEIPANATPTAIFPTRQSGEGGDDVWVNGPDGDPSSLPVESPKQLVVKDTIFNIQSSAVPEGGLWAPVIADELDAAWVEGSIINYIFGIGDNDANRELFSSLQRGDEIVLESPSGNDLLFKFRNMADVLPSQSDVFAQNQPGITILLLGDSNAESRTVIQGEYLLPDADTAFSPLADTLIGDISPDALLLREIGTLGDLSIVVNGISEQEQVGRSNTFYMVDYEIQNRGGASFNTEILDLFLQDSNGNRYELNDMVSLNGNNAPLSGVIDPGETVVATAGYSVPDGLTLDSVGWYTERLDNNEFLEFRAILEGDDALAENAVDFLVVDLYEAMLTPDGDRLALRGEAINTGAQSIIITAEDISLFANDTNYSILSETPKLPWTVNGGESIKFKLELQRPFDTEVATFSIFNQLFDLEIRR